MVKYLNIFNFQLKSIHSYDLASFQDLYICEIGSAEDEISDGAARFTKIRPMRMEMFLRVLAKELRDLRDF